MALPWLTKAGKQCSKCYPNAGNIQAISKHQYLGKTQNLNWDALVKTRITIKKKWRLVSSCRYTCQVFLDNVRLEQEFLYFYWVQVYVRSEIKRNVNEIKPKDVVMCSHTCRPWCILGNGIYCHSGCYPDTHTTSQSLLMMLQMVQWLWLTSCILNTNIITMNLQLGPGEISPTLVYHCTWFTYDVCWYCFAWFHKKCNIFSNI